MKKITIINAYGDNNIGDATILNVALEFIRRSYGNNCEIKLLVERKNNYKKFLSDIRNITPYQLPYGYAIRNRIGKVEAYKKIYRFVEIFMITAIYIILNFIGVKLPEKGFYSYIKSIKDADRVVGMGGGYLIAKNPYSDFFGLMLSLLPIYIAKIYRKKIIFLPMSFGPFANRSQELIALNSLENTTVIARDQISLGKIKHKKIKSLFAPDLGLFFNNHSYDIEKKLKSKYIVLTAREWLSADEQEKYEESLSNLIDYVWEKYKLKTIFIAMARNRVEDNDEIVAKKIMQKLNNKKAFLIKDINSLNELQKIIGNSRFSVCTRMHSAILSLTVKTPFIAIGYAHKTLGLVKRYNLENWHIDISQVNDQNITKMFDLLLQKNNYKKFINNIDKQMAEDNKYKNIIMENIK